MNKECTIVLEIMARVILFMLCTSAMGRINQQFQQEYLTHRWTEVPSTTSAHVSPMTIANVTTRNREVNKANYQSVDHILLLCLLALSLSYVFCFCLPIQMEKERDGYTRNMKPH